MTTIATVALAGVLAVGASTPAAGQAVPAAPAQPEPAPPTSVQPAASQPAVAPPVAPAGADIPPGYLIGPDDVLTVVFWQQEGHGGDVIVRPDGKITLPLINDIQAAGLTPDQLRQAIVNASTRFVRDPNVTVIVKQTNSRRVYVTGRVHKPGTYVITTPVTVLQMLALAGGIADFAKKDRIVVMRTDAGRTVSYKFYYNDVIEGKTLDQNILLEPGDTVIVP